MESNMFCYQCQETAKGTGCILKGVCGKESHTAQAMDLLLFVVRGISVVADTLRKADCPVSEEVNVFVTDALFCTITNANFDDESILKRVDKGIIMRNGLIQEAEHNKVFLPKVDELTWQGTRDDYAEKAKTVGVLREQDEDLRSLKELLVYGLKRQPIWSMPCVWDSMMIRFMFSCNAHWLPLRLSLYRQRSG